MREFGYLALAEIPASARLTDTVFRRAAAEPGVVVLRRRDDAGGWQDVTAAGFRAEVTALAGGLMAAGIEPGNRVALMSRTRYEWTLIDYACWAAGAVTVPVYETSSAEQVEWILSDSSARAVFAETGAHAEIIGRVRDRLPGLEHLWMTGELDVLAAGGAQTSAEQLEQRRAGRTATDLASIVYTSGTTGRPKGCELTHGNLLADVRNAVAALPEIFEAPGCSTLLFLPLAHAFARIIQVGCVESGAILGHWPDFGNGGGRPPRVPPYVPDRGAEGVREGLRKRPAAGVGEQSRDQDLCRRHRDGYRVEYGGRPARPGSCGCGTPRSTGSCTAGCGRRSAAGCSTRSPAARRSASGSAISSAARASRYLRVTA